MAIVAFDSNNPSYDGNLAAANGAYRVEARNLGTNSTTTLSLSSNRTVAVTFANACNLQGVTFALHNSLGFVTSTMKSVTVKLQELVLGVWTDRATVTATAATICNNSPTASGAWLHAFKFAAPYAVTTTGGVWRFEVSNATGTNNWTLWTSDGTNPFYYAWGDNQVTFASGDTVIAVDPVTINATTTVNGLTAHNTGDTTRAPAIIVGKSATGNTATDANLKWDTAASRTLTVDGFIMVGAHSTVRFGTAASPISFANKGTLTFVAPTSGSTNAAINSGFQAVTAQGDQVNGTGDWKMSVMIYGEIPSNRETRLSADANSGQPVIVTTSDMSAVWNNGDRLIIGGGTNSSQDFAIYTISSRVGTTITLTGNLAQFRTRTGTVCNLERYGFVINGVSAASKVRCILRYANNIQFSGVEMAHFGIKTARSNNELDDDTPNQIEHYINDCAVWTTTSSMQFNSTAFAMPMGYSIRRCHTNAVAIVSGVFVWNTITSSIRLPPALVTLVDNRVLNFNNMNKIISIPATITGNRFESYIAGVNYVIGISNANIICTGNEFLNTTTGLVLNSLTTCTIGTNRYNGCSSAAIQMSGFIVGEKSTSDTFGDVTPNGRDISFGQNNLQGVTPAFDFEFDTPIGLSASLIDANLLTTYSSLLRITNFNNSANDDRGYLTYGNYQRTGTGLTDTTARTSGGYALRLEPKSSVNQLTYPYRPALRIIPTGNIQNKTMTVSVWVYINNTAYDAGTYQYPRLYVKYDNATITYSEATATFGSWQQVAVTFTPTTTFGQIEVWVSALTNATGSNAYVYFDDFSVLYPAGTSINLGAMDLWADATPVWPPIATFQSPGSVWDEPTAAHTISGSFGVMAKNTKNDTAIIPALL